jgi:hypothetical protein
MRSIRAGPYAVPVKSINQAGMTSCASLKKEAAYPGPGADQLESVRLVIETLNSSVIRVNFKEDKFVF